MVKSVILAAILASSSATAMRLPHLSNLPSKIPRADAPEAKEHPLLNGTEPARNGSVVWSSNSTADPAVLIPSDAFANETRLDEFFAMFYPWGTDHNGSARMARQQITLTNDTLTLNATRVSGQKPASSGGKSIAIHYLSGAVHAKQTFTVAAGQGITYSGRFKAPVARGTWPAFWLTAAVGWPPEIDMAEWKGSGKISFNTFNTSSQVQAKDVEYTQPDEWHDIRCETVDENGKDVKAKFFMDDKLMATQVGKGFVGKAMYLIINLQMEGSSGSPGPTTNTLYQIRNVTAVRTSNSTTV